jgi:tetratricopeptide (TPR) repeat protein
MNSDEIRAELSAIAEQPASQAKATRLEALAEQARESTDRGLEVAVLLEFVHAVHGDHAAVPMERLLQLLDGYPAELRLMSDNIHRMLKWMTSSLIANPDIPLRLVDKWLDELESRYRQAGYSLRPVHDHRGRLAAFIGHLNRAMTYTEAAMAAPRDRMSDCEACERFAWGRRYAERGDYAGALEQWRPVLDGELRCGQEPHRALAASLLPLLRLGRADEARSAFLRCHSLIRGNANLRVAVGELIEFCALTGNEPRGLEIVTEHADWIDDDQIDPDVRLDFVTGVCVLLQRVVMLGHEETPLGPSTVAGVLGALDSEVVDLGKRFDARNQTTAVSERVHARLDRKSLLESLPLGIPTTLPGSSQEVPEPAEAPATLEDLIERARQMTNSRHPQAAQAWERVAESGEELSPDVSAQIARSRAGTLFAKSPAEAIVKLQEVAGIFDDLHEAAAACEARAVAAMAKSKLGDWAGARAEAEQVAAVADRIFAEHGMTPSEYLAARRAVPILAAEELAATLSARQTADTSEEDVAAVAYLVRAELKLAKRLGEGRYAATYHETLASVRSWREDRRALREELSSARELYLEVGEPWNAVRPTAYLAELAMGRGDVPEAEALAREALAEGSQWLTPIATARLRTVIVQALSGQWERAMELVDAALVAAASWNGISEPDMLHCTFAAARAFRTLGMYAEAAALFSEAMPQVESLYEPPQVATTRQEYADCLRQINDHAEAARQYLRALQLSGDSPLQSAQLAWAVAESLRYANEPDESIAAYLRAADLLRGIGDFGATARCLRSAAWIQFGDGSDKDAREQGMRAMRSVLTELEGLVSSSEDLTSELEATRQQLETMTAQGGSHLVRIRGKVRHQAHHL